MSEEMTWRLAGQAPDGSGLLAFEGMDASGAVVQRMAADVRGGVAWPFPVRLGHDLAAGGGCVVVAFTPASESGPEAVARVLRWCPCTTVGVERDATGWPVDPGIAGRIRTASVEFQCRRWYALCAEDEQEDAMRCVRQTMDRELTGVHVSAMGIDSGKLAREITWRWAVAKRLLMGDRLTEAAELEEKRYQGDGPLPVAMAIGAALRGWEENPWRRRFLEPWRRMHPGEVNRPVRV